MSEPTLLLKTIRSGYVDNEFFGFLGLFSKSQTLQAQPALSSRPFFLRSLAKPIQASVLTEFNLQPPLTSEQIAITCSSHAGEEAHVQVVLSILNKFNLSPDHLKCGVHPPLTSETTGVKPLNNNCSGKHALMLAICASCGLDLDGYLDFHHPLQQLIYKKHQELCECEDLVLTYDSCNAPVFGMPLENIAKGYFNLFLNDKYKAIKDAFLKHPELIGDKQRLDTRIMKMNPKLIAKVGAGGFLIVLNLELEQILIIKMSQDNKTPRAILASSVLLELGWINHAFEEKNIYTFAGEKVAQYVECYESLL